MVRSGGLVMIGSAPEEMKLVCPLITSAVAPEAREIVVDAVTMEPPGVSSIEPIR
jgi:hypothetical protein